MKLRKSVMVFISIGIIATFLSCDPGWDLLINDSEKVEMNFGNSKIVLSASCLKGGPYGISIEYDLESEITIHTDAFNIEYEGRTIEDYYFGVNLKTIKDKDYTLKGSGILSLGFRIHEDEKEGDTIRITAPDFITYNGKNISLGELIIIVGNKVE